MDYECSEQNTLTKLLVKLENLRRRRQQQQQQRGNIRNEKQSKLLSYATRIQKNDMQV